MIEAVKIFVMANWQAAFFIAEYVDGLFIDFS